MVIDGIGCSLEELAIFDTLRMNALHLDHELCVGRVRWGHADVLDNLASRGTLSTRTRPRSSSGRSPRGSQAGLHCRRIGGTDRSAGHG